MRLGTNRAGFSIIELLVIAAFVAILGLVGYSFYVQQTKPADTTSSQIEQSAASDVASAPSINSVGDLNKASTILDQTDPDGSNTTDANQLDGQLSGF